MNFPLLLRPSTDPSTCVHVDPVRLAILGIEISIRLSLSHTALTVSCTSTVLTCPNLAAITPSSG